MMQWVGGACTSVGVGGAQLWVGVVWSSAGGRQDSVMGGCGVVQCRWVGLSYGLAWCGPVQVGGAQLWVGMVWSSAGGWGSVMGGHGVVQCRRVVVYRCIDHVGLYQVSSPSQVWVRWKSVVMVAND